MLSEFIKKLLDESDFKSQKSFVKFAFGSDKRTHLDWFNDQINNKSKSIKNFNIVFETLLGDITLDELILLIQNHRKMKAKIIKMTTKKSQYEIRTDSEMTFIGYNENGKEVAWTFQGGGNPWTNGNENEAVKWKNCLTGHYFS